VQPGVHRLAVGTKDLPAPLERLFPLEVLCLEQERALVLIVRIQPLQVEPLIRGGTPAAVTDGGGGADMRACK
jgi:hypothetical protein